MIAGALGMAGDLPRMARLPPPLVNLTPKRRWTIGKIFAQAAAAHPDRPFLRSGKQTYTYGECNRRANRWAAVLTDRGVGRATSWPSWHTTALKS